MTNEIQYTGDNYDDVADLVLDFDDNVVLTASEGDDPHMLIFSEDNEWRVNPGDWVVANPGEGLRVRS